MNPWGPCFYFASIRFVAVADLGRIGSPKHRLEERLRHEGINSIYVAIDCELLHSSCHRPPKPSAALEKTGSCGNILSPFLRMDFASPRRPVPRYTWARFR